MDDKIIGRVTELVENGANDITVYGLINEDVARAIEETFLREFPGLSMRREPLPPPTRRQKLRYRWLRVRSYFCHLGLALVNRCDRERDDWD